MKKYNILAPVAGLALGFVLEFVLAQVLMLLPVALAAGGLFQFDFAAEVRVLEQAQAVQVVQAPLVAKVVVGAKEMGTVQH